MNKLVKQYPILGSSSNPEKISESLRGLLILMVPVIIKASGVDISEDSLIEFIDNGAIFWGMCVTMFGLSRKLYYQVRYFIDNLK